MTAMSISFTVLRINTVIPFYPAMSATQTTDKKHGHTLQAVGIYAHMHSSAQVHRQKGHKEQTHTKRFTAIQHNTQKQRDRGIQTYSHASAQIHNNVGTSTRTIPAYRHTVVRSSIIQVYRRTICPTGVQKHSKSCRRLHAYGHRI